MTIEEMEKELQKIWDGGDPNGGQNLITAIHEAELEALPQMVEEGHWIF